jgi:uncharacterized protein (DUF1697 family)
MALVVFLRGINVGGRRAFRPSVLATQLGSLDVVNVGAAGTFVIRRTCRRAELLAALREKLPFESTIAVCDGGDLIELEAERPFGTEPSHASQVRFVSILSEDASHDVPLPVSIPQNGECFVEIQGRKGRLLYGVYRRKMKTISYLGQIDRLFGARTTTRSWSTILTVLRILKSESRR